VARILLIHRDTATLRRLASYLESDHEFLAADNLKAGVKFLAKVQPTVIVVGHDTSHQDAIKLLTYMRDHRLKAAVVVVAAPGSAAHEPMLTKLGTQVLVPATVDASQFDEAIHTAIDRFAETQSGPPAITDEELNDNLSMLETRLYKEMKCFAGMNLVFIHTQVGHRAGKPRIMLRCPLRAEYGLKRDVYYEFIRDVCCGLPGRCEAHRRFKAERETA